MDTTFLYAECARRKAQKKRMLEAGEAGLKSRPVTTQDDPVPEHRPPRPPAARRRVQVRGVHKPGAAAPPPPQPQAQPQRAAPRVQQAATRPQQAAPRVQEPQQVKQVKPAKPPKPAKQVLQAQPRRPGPQARPSGSILDAPVVSSMSQVLRARAARQAGQPSAPGAARSPVPVPAPSARDERGLLESQELDLYKTGRTAKVRACPECRLELLKVLCLGTEARVCPECRGLWLPYEAVRAFAGEVEWFRQLGAAVQAASRPQSG